MVEGYVVLQYTLEYCTIYIYIYIYICVCVCVCVCVLLKEKNQRPVILEL